MDNKNPYIISVDETVSFANHMQESAEEFPLEFSKNRIWTDSFEQSQEEKILSPEYESLSEQIGQLNLLTGEIRDILNKVFHL